MLLGPFMLADGIHYGRIINMHGQLAAGSEEVTWRLITGDTAEEVADLGKLAIEAALDGDDFSSYVTETGTFPAPTELSAGRGHTYYPRTRAIWCCLWLSCTGTWAWETAVIESLGSGKWR